MSPPSNLMVDPNKKNSDGSNPKTGDGNNVNKNNDSNLANNANNDDPSKQNKDETTLLDVYAKIQQDKEKAEQADKDQRKANAMAGFADDTFTFELAKAIKIDPNANKWTVDTDYIKSINNEKYYCILPYNLPYEWFPKEPEDRGFEPNSLFFHLLFLIFFHDYSNSTLLIVLRKTIGCLKDLQKDLPESFLSFIEHIKYRNKNIFDMSHRTIRERTYIITMRNIGQWILDPNEGGNCPIDSAHEKFAVFMPGLVQQLKEYDMKKESAKIPTSTNQKQQVIVNQQSEKCFINPITSFKATASDTW